MENVELGALKDIVNAIQQNVNLNFQTMWAALAFVVTAAGASLYFLARSWVHSAVDKKMKKLEESAAEQVMQRLKREYSLIRIESIVAGGTFTLPYNQLIDSGEHDPLVFVSPHKNDYRYSFKIDKQEKILYFTNESHVVAAFEIILLKKP